MASLEYLRSFTIGLMAVATGCATLSGRNSDADPTELGSADQTTRVQMSELVVEAEADPLEGLEDHDDTGLLEAGNEQYGRGEFGVAIKIYALLEKRFPESRWLSSAVFNQAMAYEQLAEFEDAGVAYRRVVDEFPSSPSLKEALFGVAMNFAKVDRWQEVADAFWAIRQREDRTPMDELQARVGQGVAMFMMEDYPTAEKEFMSALRFHREESKLQFMPAKYWTGQSRFYLGEIAARRFEKVELSAPASKDGDWVQQMGNDLETKCEHLLRAQNNFIRAIRVGHTGWATAAGYRIGSMYEELYKSLVELPAPPDLDQGARDVYLEEVRDRVSVLVMKAIKVYETSLQMARRVGESNEWVTKTEQQLERMKTLYLASLDG